MQWAFWRRPEAKADASALSLSELYGEDAGSGFMLSGERALKVATVLACARVLAEGIAQLPFKLYRDRADGGKDLASDHPAYWLLYRRPNGWMTSFELREQLTLHAVLTGGGFAFVNRIRGQVRELIPILPAMVTVNQAPDYTLSYAVRDAQGKVATIPASSMLHLRGPSWTGIAGLEIVKLACEAIGLAAATERAQSKLFGNGARPGGTLSTDQVLDEKQIDRIKKSWQDAFSGANQFRTAVLDAGFKWEAMAMTGVDAQTLESRAFQIEEICRAMRVFPQMVMHSDKTSTYASAEQFFLAHVVHSLGPWVERWEQVVSRDVLTEDEAKAGLFPKLIVNGLLRGDAKTRADFYASGIVNGWLVRNEVRGLEDLNPLDGLDEPLRPLNMGPGSVPPVDPAKGAANAAA